MRRRRTRNADARAPFISLLIVNRPYLLPKMETAALLFRQYQLESRLSMESVSDDDEIAAKT